MSRKVRIAVGCAVGLALLWFLFRNTDWRAVLSAIGGVDVRWLVVSQLFSWSTYFARAQRWSYIVRPVQYVPYRSLFSATQIGFLVNFLIPARIGEGVRAYALARSTTLPFTRCLAMVALDRVSDVFALVVTVLVAAVCFPIAGDIAVAAGTIGNAEPIVIPRTVLSSTVATLSLAMLGGLAALVFLYVNQAGVSRIVGLCVRPVSAFLERRLQAAVANFAEGMHVFRSGRDMAKSAALSLLTWGAGALSLAATLQAFHLEVPWVTSIVILAMIAVFISVPLVPGMVGQFHLAIIVSLLVVAPQTPPALAKAVAIVTHALSLVPVGLLGSYCLVSEGMGLTGVVHMRDEVTAPASSAVASEKRRP